MGKQSRRCGLVYLCDSQILCVYQKASGLIGAPKGIREKNESDLDCAIREFREETGINLDPKTVENVPRIETIYNHVYFVVEIKSSEKPLTFQNYDQNEISHIQWISIEQLKHLPIATFTKHLLFKLRISFCKSNDYLEKIKYCNKIFEQNYLNTKIHHQDCEFNVLEPKLFRKSHSHSHLRSHSHSHSIYHSLSESMSDFFPQKQSQVLSKQIIPTRDAK